MREIKNLTVKQRIQRLVIVFVLSGLLLLPWYLFNEIRIFYGAKTNVDILMSTELHQGRTPLERFLRAIRVMGIYAYLYPFVILTLPFTQKAYRWIIATILLPYSIIWGFLFSLETRNLSIALPLLGVATGLGAGGLTTWTAGLIHKIRLQRLKTSLLVLLAAGLLAAGSLLVPAQPLIERQTDLQRESLIPKINHRLYDYFEETGGYEPIFTNYPLKYLPELADYQIEIGAFADYPTYRKTLDEHPDVRYMLVQTWRIDDQIDREIKAAIDNHSFEVIFETNNYIFLRMLDR